MGVIKDLNTNLGTLYQRYNTKNEIIQTVGVIGFSKEFEGHPYFIITDFNGKRIKEANLYLNSKILNASYKKRELSFTALKLFYSFVHLYNIYDYQKGLKYEDLQKLITFLEGGQRKGILFDLDFKTTRNNQTINNYLTVYRDFYKSIFNINDSNLSDKSAISIQSGGGMMGHANKKTIEKYRSNKKVIFQETPPKYIKQEEYTKIIQLIKEKYSSRELCIINLMYLYGLRLGEVLGLTLEDLEEGNYGNYRLILRNRVSDKPWQSAKSVMNVINHNDYQRKIYSIEGNGAGYQSVIIDSTMMDLIEQYIEETRDEILLNQSDIKRTNLETQTKADKVGNKNLMFNENQYIFLNQNHYTPLTSAGWNYVLRQIFEEVGISTDKDVKENNLSHRFRHGFAMNKVQDGYSEVELASMLRHSNTMTVKRYFNPDEEYKVKLLEKQRNEMK